MAYILTMLLPSMASAENVNINGIWYNLVKKVQSAEVAPNNEKYSGDIVIPTTVEYEGVIYNVTSIGKGAFNGCYGLKSVSIPNSVVSIEGYAFQTCSNLTTLDIPNSVTSIGERAFAYCPKLISVSIPNGITTIENETFRECKNLTSVNLPNSVTSIGDGAFNDCRNLLSVNIPDNVTTIGQAAFLNCFCLTPITLPSNLTSIGNYAFMGCYGMTSLTIPNSVTSIGSEAFEYCKNITSATIGNNVTDIYFETFKDCTSLKTVIIGNSVKNIYQNAFSGCQDLEDVYCYAEEVPNTNSTTFEGSYIEYATLHVPSSLVNSYKATDPWKYFKSIVKIDLPKHTITYMVDGKVYKSYELEEGENITPEPDPTKEGYTFSGWSNIPSKMPDHDVTITGTFTINKYKLVYKVDGTEYKSYDVEYGASITPEPAPSKEGYTFSGWSDIPSTMPAYDVTVTGSFTKDTYRLIYKIEGEVYKTVYYDYGETITPEPAPTKEGYTFSGWSWIPSTMPAENVVVTGSFTVNKYVLTYMVDGEVYKSVQITYGETVTPEPAPTKEGYTFSGWSWIPKRMPAEDVTVTGTFKANKYKLIYMVDGAEYKIYNIDYGATVTPEAEPTKEGYTFSGWSWIPKKMPAEDVTVTGSFTINKYKLTYMIDDEVYKVVVYEYGATITPEPKPDGDYNEFEWVGLPEKMPARDVTVYARYTTGIVEVLMTQGIKRIYNTNGKQLGKLQKGLNIVVMNDGTVRKVVVNPKLLNF